MTNDTFQGESLVDQSAVLHLLVDDVDLLLEAGGPSHGRVLSGTPVVLTAHDGDTVRARTVEGRVSIEFVTESDAVFPTERWPRPDPDEQPPKEWPVGDKVVPPRGGRLTVDSAGRDPVATVGPQVYGVEDLLLEPAQGRVTFAVLEQTELDARVRLVTPTLWVDGYAGSIEWREEPPAGGWNPLEGIAPLAPWVGAARQLGDKDAPISTEAQGLAFGKLVAGARVVVHEEEKGWMKVSAAWRGGDVSGWIQKKYVLKEGKEEAVTPVPAPVSAVALWQMARQWSDVTGHEEEDEEGASVVPEPEIDLESVRRQITDRFGPLRVAYARILKGDPTKVGTLTGRVVVDADGTIVKAHLPEGSLRDPALQEAVVAILEGLVFEPREIPKPKRRKKKDEPDVDWSAQVWIQFSFKSTVE